MLITLNIIHSAVYLKCHKMLSASIISYNTDKLNKNKHFNIKKSHYCIDFLYDKSYNYCIGNL